jgi:hypothetical protein
MRNKWIQQSLNQILGLRLVVDGVIGPKTRSAIRSFQRRAGLIVDGIVGPQTTQALVAAGASPPPPAGAPSTPGAGLPAPIATNIPALRRNMAQTAVREWERWHRGAVKEDDPAIRPTLRDYWQTGAGLDPDTTWGDPQWWSNFPWSAAFISWVARNAGSGNAFKYSGAHSQYIVAAKANRLENSANPFKAFRISEVQPRVGDLVCTSRANSGATYDNIHYPMATHCDVVTEVRPREVVSIGGNVSQSVARTIVPLDQGGRVSKSGYFAVIRSGD